MFIRDTYLLELMTHPASPLGSFVSLLAGKLGRGMLLARGPRCCSPPIVICSIGVSESGHLALKDGTSRFSTGANGTPGIGV